jgi:dTMP kinase
MQRGRFITIEGGEGVGKSTHIAGVRDAIARAGFDVIVTREPGGTPRAESIRELLLKPADEAMPQVCELLLMFAARSTHIDNVIRPTLQRGVWVVCDRFTDATYAYQGGGRHMPHEQIAALEQMVQRELRPDLTLLLDAPIDLAMARARARNAQQGNAGGDRFEREQQAFFERVRSAYLDIAKREQQRMRVIDASQSLEQVSQAVQQCLQSYLQRIQREVQA